MSNKREKTPVGERSLLGFDFGQARIGVAVGQELSHTASPLVTLKNIDGGPDWAAIGKLIDEWQADALVVGIPLQLDGEEHEMTRLARRFGNRLHGRYNLPVYTVDERFTSIEAERRLKEQGVKVTRENKGEVDRLAAQLILQTWLDKPDENQ